MKLKKDISKMSRKDFLKIKNFETEKYFTHLIIVPTKIIHDSGYNGMKYILYNSFEDEIVGAISGWSDICHINGIGGFGINFNFKTPKAYHWKIDCLPKSKCLRIFCNKLLQINNNHNFVSDFEFYVVEEEVER